MSETSTNSKLRLTFFHHHFPKMAEHITNINFMVEEENGVGTYEGSFIGPFLYGSNSNYPVPFLIYTPHYIIRYAPRELIIELLPFNSFLTKKILFIFSSQEEKEEMYRLFKISDSCKDLFPIVVQPFEVSCSCKTQETNDTKHFKILIKDYTLKVLKPKEDHHINADSNITTLFEMPEITSKTFPFGFALYSIFPTTIFLGSTSIDTFLVMFLMIEYVIKHIHDLAVLNTIVENYAEPFPERMFKFIWRDKLELCSSEGDLLSPFNTMIKNTVSFKGPVTVPEKTRHGVGILSFEKPIKRTVLLYSNEPTDKTKHRRFMMRNNMNTHKEMTDRAQSFKDSLAQMREEIIDVEEIEEIEASEDQTNDRFIDKTGEEMLYQCFGFSNIEQEITSYAKSIGISKELDPSLLETDFLTNLEVKVCLFNQKVDIRSKEFIDFLVIIESILKCNAKLAFFFEAIMLIVNDKDYIQLSSGDKDSIFEKLIIRLIMQNKLHNVLSELISNKEMMTQIYGRYSPLYATPFSNHFIRIIKKMERSIFYGKPPLTLQYRDVEIPNMTSYIIWDKATVLNSRLRNGLANGEDIFDFIFSVIDFINAGIIIQNKQNIINCCGILRMAAINIPKSCNSIFTAANKILESMKDKTAHILILDLSDIARKSNTHTENSPLRNDTAVISVAQCIYDVSSFGLSSFTESALTYAYLLQH